MAGKSAVRKANSKSSFGGPLDSNNVRLCKYLERLCLNPWLADFHTETKKNMLFL